MFHVEQTEMTKYTRNSILILSFGLVLGLFGCKEAVDPNPELRDPIYKDFQESIKVMEGAVVAQEKKIVDAKGDFKKLSERDPFRKRQFAEIFKLERSLVDLRQQALYFKVRLEQRKAYARVEYLKAYNADQPWPDPKEWERYKISKDLIHAPRSWDARVPKLTRSLPNGGQPTQEGKKEEKGEKKAEH
jgi:hypothetical protein